MSLGPRAQEIGVRIALGASGQSVVRLIVGQALRLVFVGVALGLGAAMLLARSLVTLLAASSRSIRGRSPEPHSCC
jgi:ABC-type antimicrobial peptide transport system permease subunit